MAETNSIPIAPTHTECEDGLPPIPPLFDAAKNLETIQYHLKELAHIACEDLQGVEPDGEGERAQIMLALMFDLLEDMEAEVIKIYKISAESRKAEARKAEAANA